MFSLIQYVVSESLVILSLHIADCSLSISTILAIIKVSGGSPHTSLVCHGHTRTGKAAVCGWFVDSQEQEVESRLDGMDLIGKSSHWILFPVFQALHNLFLKLMPAK